MEALGVEIRKVLLSPYAVSLKGLEETLKIAGLHEYRIWALTHPCQTKALASAVLNALEFCPYALSVLEQTGRAVGVRDEMLRLKPTLLDTLLRSALQDENNFDKYSHACLSLLSSPLPAKFPPPAYLVTFFLRCVDIAAKNTNVESIKAVYTLVANGFRQLSELLTPAQSRSFSDQMALFLSIQGQRDTNTLLVLSLATLAHMAIAVDSTEPTPSEENARLRSGPAGFFRDKKAQRVLHLVTNIVIDLAARDSADWGHTTELINMAIVIAETVASSIKKQWCTTKEASLLQRLLEKTLRPGIESHVSIEVLRFVEVFHAASPMPRLQETFEKLVEKNNDNPLRNSLVLPPELASLFATIDSSEPIVRVLRSNFELASTQPEFTHNIYNIIQSRITFLQAVIRNLQTSQKIRTAILEALITNEFSSIIDDFMASIKNRPVSAKCEDCEACPFVIVASQRQLQQTICKLILQSAMYSETDSTVRIDPILGSALMEKIMILSTPSKECPTVTLTMSNHNSEVIAMFEASGTPEVRISSRNWRQNLMDGMARETNRQHKYVVSAIGEICRDLEKRCETIEQPLREEEQRSQQLREALSLAERRREDLEKEVVSRIHAMEDMEQDKHRLENKLDGTVSKINDYIDRIRDLEEALKESRADAVRVRQESEQLENERETVHKEEIERLRESADRNAMEQMGILSDRQDRIDELEHISKDLEEQVEAKDRYIQELEADMEAKEQRINELGSERQDLLDQVEQLKTAIKASSAEVEAQISTLGEREQKIKNLEHALEEMTQEEQHLKVQIEGLDKSCKSLEGEIETLKNQSEKKEEGYVLARENLINSHAEQISQLNTERINEKNSLEQTITNLRSNFTRDITIAQNSITNLTSQKADLEATLNTLRDTHNSTLAELAATQKENKSLANKLHKLYCAQEQKEREAKTLTRQLLGLMGGGGSEFAQLLSAPAAEGPPEMVAPVSPVQPRAVFDYGGGLDAFDFPPAPGPQVQNRRRSRAVASGAIDGAQESPGKPTPKRTKTRQSLAPPPAPALGVQKNKNGESQSPQQRVLGFRSAKAMMATTSATVAGVSASGKKVPRFSAGGLGGLPVDMGMQMGKEDGVGSRERYSERLKRNKNQEKDDIVEETPEGERERERAEGKIHTVRRTTTTTAAAATWESDADESQYGTGILLTSTQFDAMPQRTETVAAAMVEIPVDLDETMDF